VTVTGVALAMCCFPSVAAAQQVQLSPIEQATVRVFTCRSLTMQHVMHQGEAVVVAVPEVGHGSGVVVTSDGIVLTARHVVRDASGIAVKLPLADHAIPAVVVYEDPDLDFAFLKVRGELPAHVQLPAESAIKTLATRDRLFSIGYPLDPSASTPTTQEGIVSRLTEEGMLQTSAALNPGHSGGPAFIEAGGRTHLIGIAIARHRTGEGMGLILPIRSIVLTWNSRRVQTELAPRVMERFQQSPWLWQSLERYSLLVAEMTEAFLNQDDPSFWFNMPGADGRGAPAFIQSLSSLAADDMVPEAQLLVAGYLWNVFVATRNDQALRMCVEIVMRLRSNHPDTFSASPFAQSLAQVVERNPGGSGIAAPGEYGMPGTGYGTGYMGGGEIQPPGFETTACGIEGGPCCGSYCTEGLSCIYGQCSVTQECNRQEPCPEGQVCAGGTCAERPRIPLFLMRLGGGIIIDDHPDAPWVNGGAGTISGLFQVLRLGTRTPWMFSLVVGIDLDMGGWRDYGAFTALADLGVRLLLGSPRIAASMAFYYNIGVAVAEDRTSFAYLAYRAMAGLQLRSFEVGLSWSETGRSADTTLRLAELYVSWGI
jgi:hypothetical protein